MASTTQSLRPVGRTVAAEPESSPLGVDDGREMAVGISQDGTHEAAATDAADRINSVAKDKSAIRVNVEEQPRETQEQKDSRILARCAMVPIDPQDPTGPCMRILTEEAGYEYTGFHFSPRKKWAILSVIFAVQISMNFNAAIYANAVPSMVEEFQISEFTARLGQFIFLIMYAFGCELWAPWSEELGRKWVLQGSLLLVNIWQIPCAMATGFWTIFGFRLLGGLSSAGGSVTLGMVADMWEPAEQQYAVAFVVFSSVAGSVVAPITGGAMTQYLDFRWIFWISLIFGAVVQFAHCFVPETRSTLMLAQRAKKLRKRYPGCDVYGPDEIKGSLWKRLDWKECCKLMWRPYHFLFTEQIVTALSLLSGYGDALIYTGLDSFGPVLDKWNFNPTQKGLGFLPLLIGYVIAWASFIPVYRKDRQVMRADRKNGTKKMKPERRLWWLLYTVPLMPIGLMGFGFCSMGPDHTPWIAPLLFVGLIGIANFAIYMATIDYMIAAYGPYAASATGGNGFCRDFLAGIAALYAKPMYTNIKKGMVWQTVIPTQILAAMAVVVCVPVYHLYINGEGVRKKSPFACELEHSRDEAAEKRTEAIARTEAEDAAPRPSRPSTPRWNTEQMIQTLPWVQISNNRMPWASAPTSRRVSDEVEMSDMPSTPVERRRSADNLDFRKFSGYATSSGRGSSKTPDVVVDQDEITVIQPLRNTSTCTSDLLGAHTTEW